MGTINLLVVDDHALFIEGLSALLDGVPGLRFLATGSNGAEAVRLVEEHPKATMLVIDLSMPEMDGVEAARTIRSSGSTIPILALTQNDDGGSISRAVKAGVDGYVLKTADRSEFVEAIETIAAGGTYFSQRVKDTLLFSVAGRNTGEPVELTERERDVIILIANEKTTREIAEELHISTYTVDTHRKNMIQKLGVRNLAGLVRYAVEKGLVE